MFQNQARTKTLAHTTYVVHAKSEKNPPSLETNHVLLLGVPFPASVLPDLSSSPVILSLSALSDPVQSEARGKLLSVLVRGAFARAVKSDLART